jgi:hypothetical protein
MKKIICLSCALVLAVAMIACGGSGGGGDTPSTTGTTEDIMTLPKGVANDVPK